MSFHILPAASVLSQVHFTGQQSPHDFQQLKNSARQCVLGLIYSGFIPTGHYLLSLYVAAAWGRWCFWEYVSGSLDIARIRRIMEITSDESAVSSVPHLSG